MRRIVRSRELPEDLPEWRPAAPRASQPVKRPGPQEAVTATDSQTDSQAELHSARERGLGEGMRAAETAYRTKLARLDALVATLGEERREFFDRVEPEVVRLASAIAEKIIGEEMELRPERVVDLVREAMKRLRDREALCIRVSPQDLDLVKEARDDLMGSVDGVRKLELVEDRRVDRGGCVIESENGALDARIKTQMSEIERVLGEVETESEANDGPES